MSKLSFRARPLEPSKPMPIYLAEELPDLPEYSAINRAVPQMPSGMEKEEESEHHLQRAICTGLIIPTPEVFAVDKTFYDANYPPDYKMPRQLIHMQPLGLEQDVPDYDMDSSDEFWVNQQSRRLDLTPIKFEQMMDRLEKSSGQTVVTLNEAKALLKQDDEISIAVYDYWLNKRLKTQHPLLLSVKTENRSGNATNSPYLAFRRRTEKMQTRKNRKNDETSYEKMLKLRRDLSRAVTLLEMVKRREKTKREQLHLSIEVFEKRFQARDFNGSLLSELNTTVKNSRPAFAPIFANQYSHHTSAQQSGLTSSSSTSLGHQSSLNANSNIIGQQRHLHHHHSHLHGYSTSQQYLNSTLSGNGIVGNNNIAGSNKRDYDSMNAGSSTRKEKRQYKKRKHKIPRDKHQLQYNLQNNLSPAIESNLETDDDDGSGSLLGNRLLPSNNSNAGNNGILGGPSSDGEEEGLYAFKRNKNCEYHKPLTKESGNWPWESPEENGSADPKYRFTLTSIRNPRPRCVGFARRRVGRGGRILLDRCSTNLDDFWSQLDYTIFDNKSNINDKINNINNSISSSNNNNLNNYNNNNLLKTTNNLISSNIVNRKNNLNKIITYTTTTNSTTSLTSQIKLENNENELNLNKKLTNNKLKTLLNDTDSDLDENMSRDSKYLSSSTEPLEISNLLNQQHPNNLNNKLNFIKKLKSLNFYNNNLNLINNNNSNNNNSITKISNYILNKHLKLEQNENLNLQHQQNTTMQNIKTNKPDQIVVDLIRNNDLKNNNNNLLLNKQYDKNIVIKLEDNDGESNITMSAQNPTNNNNKNSNSNKNSIIKIKEESIDLIDDNNSTINIHTDILDDENVNLARLSSYIHALKSPKSNNSNNNNNNQSIKNEQQNVKVPTTVTSNFDLLKSSESYNHCNLTTTSTNNKNINSNIQDNIISNSSKSNSNINLDLQDNINQYDNNSDNNFNIQENDIEIESNFINEQEVKKLQICNEFLQEIQKDWLHFHPKTPSPSPLNSPVIIESPLVEFSENDKIQIQIQHLTEEPPSSVLNCDNQLILDTQFESHYYETQKFSFTDLLPDDNLIKLFPNSDFENSSNGGDLSGGDSELNLSLGDDNDNEKMLDNILQECQIDDLKTLNQTTNFWNGILDGSGLDDDVAETVNVDGDNNNIGIKKSTSGNNDSITNLTVTSKIGYSSELLLNLDKKSMKKSIDYNHSCSEFKFNDKIENFFKKEDISKLNCDPKEVKIEPPDEILASPPPPSQHQLPLTIQQPQPAPTLIQKPIMDTTPIDPVIQNSIRTSTVNTNNAQMKTPIAFFNATQQQLQIIGTANSGTPIYLNQTGNTNPVPTIGFMGQQKFYIKQEALVPNLPQQQQQQIITFSNVKLENNLNNLSSSSTQKAPASVTTAVNNLIADAGGNVVNVVNASGQQGNLIVTQPQNKSGPPQHILLQQIGGTTIVSGGNQGVQQPQTAQIINVSNSGLTTLTDGTTSYVLANSTGANPKQIRQINGPTDRNALQQFIKQQQANKFFINRKIQITQAQQPQLKQDDDSNKLQQTTTPQQTGNFIKLSSYPVVVSDLNVVPSQSHSTTTSAASLSAVAVANHNYSLQPSAQPITIIGQQNNQQSNSTGNKIILNTSSANQNYTLAEHISQKINYQQLHHQQQQHHQQQPTTGNIKVNLGSIQMVANPSGTSSTSNSNEIIKVQQGGILTLQQQQHQHLQQQGLPAQQKHKLEKLNMYIDTDKNRLLYTKLVNLSQLHQHKNNNQIGQTIQISSGGSGSASSSGANQQQILTTTATVSKGATIHRIDNLQQAALIRAAAAAASASSNLSGITATASGNLIVANSGASNSNEQKQQQQINSNDSNNTVNNLNQQSSR